MFRLEVRLEIVMLKFGISRQTSYIVDYLFVGFYFDMYAKCVYKNINTYNSKYKYKYMVPTPALSTIKLQSLRCKNVSGLTVKNDVPWILGYIYI